jgi:DNA-binding response OmpR family regulator
MPQNVLIVDDAVPMHELIKVHLSDEPWVLHSAFDGPSALALTVTLNPDLILLDVEMPEMNGFDVCRALKADQETAQIPVIFLTAATSVDAKICGLELRAVDYVTKPFEPGELCARIRVALRTKRLLDLLPPSSFTTESPAHKKPSIDGRQVNARLSMKQLMHARGENPWDRKPPPPTLAAANPQEKARRQE